MSDHDGEFARLTRAREAADLSYNEALTALDRTIGPRPDLPGPPIDFDDRQLPPLNESWRLLPDGDLDLGSGWRRRLRGVAWRLIGPILQRQQRFNALLVEHLNRNVGGERTSRAALAALIAAFDRHLETLAVFQGQLVQYLQQITLYVDTKDRHQAGELRRDIGAVNRDIGAVNRDIGAVRAVAEGLAATLDSVTDELRKCLESTLVRADATTETLTGMTDRVRTLEDENKQRAAEQEGLSQSVELVMSGDSEN